MPQDRFFIDSHLTLHGTTALEEVEFHHLANVMRIKEKESIELVNGQGQLASATVKKIEKRKALLEIDSLFCEEKPKSSLILAQALPRLNRLDFILEKITELGITEIWLFAGKLSEKKALNENQWKRARQLVIAAMKQSGRLFLPKIEFFSSLEKCPIQTTEAYFGDLSDEAPSLVSAYKKAPSVAMFIGPEKGLNEGEIEWLKENKAQGVTLNQNILRTDTAAIASVALLSHLGNF